MPEPTTLTRLNPTTHLITLSSPPDNRLTPAFLNSLSENLDKIELYWRERGGGMSPPDPSKKDTKVEGGAVIITGIDRFFSNGLDYVNANKNKRFFEDVYDPVLYRLMTFPLVTIAAINGHAFAGGMVLALACDYRIMTTGKGLMCMNEMSFGSPLPNSFANILKVRLPSPQHQRDCLLGHRFNQKQLLDMGLLDGTADPDKLMDVCKELAEREGPRVGWGVWGVIKDQLYHSLMEASQSLRPNLIGPQAAKQFYDRIGQEPKAKL